jgi:hypothetical protein
MCEFHSGIITYKNKKAITDLDEDSHEFLLEKAGLSDSRNDPNFVRVEIVPGDGNIFNHDLSNWALKVDQDIIPDWFDSVIAERLMKESLQNVFRERFFINRKNKIEINNQRVFLENSHAELWGSSHAELWGSSHAELWDSSHAVLRDSSHAVLWGSSHAVLWDSSHAVLRGSSHAVLWGSSHAVLSDSSHAELWDSSHAVLWGSSHAELWDSSHAELRGSSYAELWGSSHAELWDSSHAVLRGSSHAELWGSSHACKISNRVIIEKIEEYGTVMDLSIEKPQLFYSNPEIEIKLIDSSKI